MAFEMFFFRPMSCLAQGQFSISKGAGPPLLLALSRSAKRMDRPLVKTLALFILIFAKKLGKSLKTTREG